MQKKDFNPCGVCARHISFEYENGKMFNLRFIGGCNGNLKVIGKLCEGRNMKEIADILEGNICNGKPTSCADQLAKAIREVI